MKVKTPAILLMLLSAIICTAVPAYADPYTPAAPDGPWYGQTYQTYYYNAVTWDTNELPMQYVFDWGDGSNYDWTDWTTTGVPATFGHAFAYAGTYYVRVLAVNANYVFSDWSEYLQVDIVDPPPPNQAPNKPSAPSGPTSGSVNGLYTFSSTATDPDGDQIQYIFYWGDDTQDVTNPVSSGVEATIDHRWAAPGTYWLTVQAFDSQGNYSALSDYVSIEITFANTAPTANNQNISTPEDTAKAITLTASDPEGNVLTYAVASQPAHGTLTGTVPNITYTPYSNYNGSDSFTFKVNDGQLDSNTATVSINVTAVNDAPIANGQSLTTSEDTAKSIILTGSDVDGDSLTYSLVSLPGHGTISGTTPNITYTPAANYNGSDSFTFKVDDGHLVSNTATVNITITPVNDAPVANTQSVTTNENTAKSIILTGGDVDGDSLTYTVLSNPGHGTLSGTAPNLTYTPNTNYYGSDSFTFKVRDAALDSNTATVSINVSSVNNAPVASNQSVSTAEDTAKAITLTASDVENDTLTYIIVSGPAHGSISGGTSASRTYTPNANYNGNDFFTFKANDTQLDSNVATVTITVTSVNDAPSANPQSVTTAEDTAKSIVLSGADVDGDSLTYTVVAQPAHGTISSGTTANRTYTPAANYNGPDSFTFKVNDGTIDSGVATVSITVTPVNDAPVANAQSVTTPESTAKTIILSGSDVDGDTLNYTVLSNPAHGTLSGTAPNLTYTPTAFYNGPDSFTFKVRDAALDSNTATVSINVSSVNNAPVASAQSVSTAEDTAKVITLVATDIENDTLTYIIVSGPAHGSISGGTSASRTYTPAEDFNGNDSFTFKANDSQLNSNVATVTVTVTPVNDAPVAVSQSVHSVPDTPKTITLAGADVDGDALTYTVLTQPINGILSGTAPNLTYTPKPGYNGSDSFTFKVNDGNLDSAPVTVTIILSSIATPINDPAFNSTQIIAYPNPFSPSENPAQANITFAGLPKGELVFRIFSMSGIILKEWNTETGSGQVSWSADDKDGKKLSSGVYAYTITNNAGLKKKGKIAIIR